MNAKERPNLTIEACYDAVFEPQRLPAALQLLAESVGATSCVVRAWDDSHPFAADRRKWPVPAPDSTEHSEFTALWLERVEGAPDPHLDRPRRLSRPFPSFIVEDEITTPHERAKLPYYQEIARPGKREWFASLQFKVGVTPWCLGLFRDGSRGPFELREGDRVVPFAAPLSRAIGAAEKLWAVSVGLTLEALDRRGCAAITVDRRRDVRRLNGCADRLFGSDLLLRNKRIRAAHRQSDRQLQELITSALVGPSFRTTTSQIVIERSGRPWLLVEALPLGNIGRDLFSGGEILLLLTDLFAQRMASERLLCLTFQLTEAEARLAARLAAGEGVGRASRNLGVSRETVRTHLKSIFAKTGTRRQAELTALLSRLPPTSDHFSPHPNG